MVPKDGEKDNNFIFVDSKICEILIILRFKTFNSVVGSDRTYNRTVKESNNQTKKKVYITFKCMGILRMHI